MLQEAAASSEIENIVTTCLTSALMGPNRAIC
jgi:hypothetical protein